jgi:hypothetical protein
MVYFRVGYGSGLRSGLRLRNLGGLVFKCFELEEEVFGFEVVLGENEKILVAGEFVEAFEQCLCLFLEGGGILVRGSKDSGKIRV